MVLILPSDSAKAERAASFVRLAFQKGDVGA
jgi:hypothetical protein